MKLSSTPDVVAGEGFFPPPLPGLGPLDCPFLTIVGRRVFYYVLDMGVVSFGICWNREVGLGGESCSLEIFEMFFGKYRIEARLVSV